MPTAHGKCDTTLYRDAGTEVVAVLTRGGCRCERASVDEVYVDVSELARAFLQQRGLEAAVAIANTSHVAGECRVRVRVRVRVRLDQLQSWG